MSAAPVASCCSTRAICPVFSKIAFAFFILDANSLFMARMCLDWFSIDKGMLAVENEGHRPRSGRSIFVLLVVYPLARLVVVWSYEWPKAMHYHWHAIVTIRG
eukprot:6186986-Pleurochrysis_carterae.AAC.8